jgi:hypothetical protein
MARMKRHFAFALLLAAATPAALAFCPEPPPKVCGVFFRSEQVFLGKLLSRRYAGPDGDEIEYTFERTRTFRGDVPARVKLRTGNDSGAWTGDKGKSYVLFAREGHIGGHCSAVDDATQATATIADIRQLANVHDASIEGETVLFEGRGGAPAPAATLRFEGAAGTFETRTNADGRFAIHVPPGHYTLVTRGWTPSVYSGGHGVIVLERGQCAQLQLVPAPVR